MEGLLGRKWKLCNPGNDQAWVWWVDNAGGVWRSQGLGAVLSPFTMEDFRHRLNTGWFYEVDPCSLI